MATPWKQGDVLPPAALQSLGIDADNERLLVVSHSCDLVRMSGERLAVVSGRKSEADHGKRGAKSIRWLQLTTPLDEFIDYDIDTFRF